MPDFVQRSPAQDPNALPAHPVVTQGATQTNANTGGPLYWGNPGAPITAMPVPVGGMTSPKPGVNPDVAAYNLSLLSRQDPGVGARLAHQGALNPAGGAAPPSPQHAAAAAMQYLVGHAEGVSKGANAAAVGAAPDYASQMAPAAPVPYAGYAPQAAPTSRAPAAEAPAQAPAPAAPQGAHPLNAAAGVLPRDQFVKAFSGVPLKLVYEAMQAAHPPAIDDQAKSMAVQSAEQAHGDMLGKLLLALGLGPNYVPFAGMNQGQ